MEVAVVRNEIDMDGATFWRVQFNEATIQKPYVGLGRDIYAHIQLARAITEKMGNA